MDPVRNPYSPGAGRPPAALVGREREVEAWRVALERAMAGRTAQSMVLYGLRGVGKTVLLTSFATAARRREWFVAQVEAAAGRPLRDAVGEALHGPLADAARPGAGRRLLKALRTALSFKASYDTTGTWSFGLDLSEGAGGGADTGVLETDLAKLARDLSGAAQEEGVGVALVVDEAQDLTREEMTALCAVAHAAGQEGWPLVIALGGLPSLPRALAEAKSYSERLFAFAEVEHLSDIQSAQAIREPARAEGVYWDSDAVAVVVRSSKGYPYFLQQFGQETWNVAAGPTVGTADAREGCARGWAALDTGFFRARWDRATKAEQAYLRAMAVDGDAGSTASDLAARLGRQTTSLGPARAKLIAKGLVYAPEHGVVAFTVPGMAKFIGRQSDG